MVTIIIISNDSHVMMLKDHFQPLIRGQISIYTDFEKGLMAVFDKRPATVFIQREIDGTAAEVIARQIKSLLREGAPRLVLMGALAGTAPDGVKCFDDSFDFATTEEELYAFFRDQLEKIPFLLWNDINTTPEQTSSKHDLNNPMDVFKPVTESEASALQNPFMAECQDNLTDHEHISKGKLSIIKGDSPLQTAPGHFTADLPADEVPEVSKQLNAPFNPESVSNEAVEPVNPDCRSLPPYPTWDHDVASASSPAEIDHAIDELRDDFSSFGLLDGGSKWKSRSTVYFAVVMVAAVAGIALYMLDVPFRILDSIKGPAVKKEKQPSVTVAPPAQVRYSSPRQKQLATLPEIVPVNGRDPKYATTHPGWERYVAEDLEFLVFREGVSIKAIQVIANGPAGIADNRIMALLQQATGSSSFNMTGTRVRNDYNEQQASLPNGGEMIIYRKKSNAQVRGAVISLP